jgi:hypothetical protein
MTLLITRLSFYTSTTLTKQTAKTIMAFLTSFTRTIQALVNFWSSDTIDLNAQTPH